MPYRWMSFGTIALGVVGFIILALLILLGKDVYHATRTGPKWKRAPLAVSLLLLTMLGIGISTNTSCIFTCYVPVPGAGLNKKDFQSKLEHLNQQLPLLEKYARDEKIEPEVVMKVLESVQIDVYVLETAFAKKKLNKQELERAQELCRRAKVTIEKIEMQLGQESEKGLTD